MNALSLGLHFKGTPGKPVIYIFFTYKPPPTFFKNGLNVLTSRQYKWVSLQTRE